MFRFRKVYVDTVTSEGDVCIVYLTRLHLLGAGMTRAWVEFYDRDGGFETVQGLLDPGPSFEQRVHEGYIRLALPDGAFEMWLVPRHGAWRPNLPAMSPWVDWSVVVAQARTRIRWSGAFGDRELGGLGYADSVELRRIPRRIGLKQLDWGRIHWPGHTLVFDSVSFERGDHWLRMGTWMDRQVHEWHHPFGIKSGSTDTHVLLPEHDFLLEPVRTLTQGSALDAGRLPRRLERALIHGISGPMHEQRWLSHVHHPQFPEPGVALHECVHFGEPASLSRELS